MDRLADEKYTYLLLWISENMTLEEKSQFGFCCRAFLPASVLERKDLLEMFRHLEQQEELSPRNLRQLKKFLEYKQRSDLLEAVREFEVGLSLMDIFRVSYSDDSSDWLVKEHSVKDAFLRQPCDTNALPRLPSWDGVIKKVDFHLVDSGVGAEISGLAVKPYDEPAKAIQQS
ncbi:predicted protein [Nematostella vectensis]|uniref:DED domain-containing protein n=1 Tax=Nematostella vectensis TaxID=45351 RepID=A7SXS1_NEMVE|nr:predicted protein [Nematostella vectensis]|eukprot:XP_001623605.1 predicted protein [Nematostella vectensis]